MAFYSSRDLPYTILQQNPPSAGPEAVQDDEPHPDPPRAPMPSPHDYLYLSTEPYPQTTNIAWPVIHDPTAARVSIASSSSSSSSRSNRCNTPASSVPNAHRATSRLGDDLPNLPVKRVEFNAANLHFICNNLSHPGNQAFFSVRDAGRVLSVAVEQALDLLYAHRTLGQSPRCITLKLAPMDGVAYTKGSELDDLHKEIHLSSDYLSKIPADNRSYEIAGVVLHEVVHCLQWHGLGTAPSGLIEGIADWVRLKADLAPPHWKRSADGRWDQGYEKTAYFLDWLAADEQEALVRVNGYLKDHKYDEKEFWPKMFAGDVGMLWRQYGQALKMEEIEQRAESETRRPTPFRAFSPPTQH